MAKKNVEGQMDLFEIFGSVEELEENVKGVPELSEAEAPAEMFTKEKLSSATMKLENQQAVMQKTFRSRTTKQTAVIAYLNYNKVYQKIWDEEPVIYQFEQSKDAVDYYVGLIGQFFEDEQAEVLKAQETLQEAKVLPWMKNNRTVGEDVQKEEMI